MDRMNRDKEGSLLDMVGNGSIGDLNDIDLNFMAEPWSESEDDEESPTVNESLSHPPPNTNDTITNGPPHESPVAQEPSLLSGPPKDSNMASPNMYNLSFNSNINAPPIDTTDRNADIEPSKDNEIISQTSTNNGPLKDNENINSLTKTNNGPTIGPPKDNEIISPPMYTLSLGGTNPPPTTKNNSLYDTPKAPSTYTRGRKTRQKGKKFSNSQIGRFDKESENAVSKKKEEEKKTSVNNDATVSSPIVTPASPVKDTNTSVVEQPAAAVDQSFYISSVDEQQSTENTLNTQPLSQLSAISPIISQPSLKPTYISPIEPQPSSINSDEQQLTNVPVDQNNQSYISPVEQQSSSTNINPDIQVSAVPVDQNNQSYISSVEQPANAISVDQQQQTYAVPADQQQTYAVPADQQQTYAVPADQQQYYATVDANGNQQYVDPNNPQYASYYAQYGYNYGYGYGYGYGYTDGSSKPEMVENSTMTEVTEETKDRETEQVPKNAAPVETADEGVQTINDIKEVEKEDVGLQTKEIKVKDSSVLTDPDQRRPIYRQKDRIPDGVRLPATVVEYDFLKDDDYLFSPLSSKNLPLNVISKSTESLDAFTNNISSAIVTDKNNKYVCFIDGKNIHVIQEQKKFKFVLGGHASNIIHIDIASIENKYVRLLSIDEEGVIIVHEFDESKNILEDGKLSPDFCTIIMAIKSSEYQIYCAAFRPNNPNSFVVGTNMKCALYFNIEDNLWKRKINAVEEDSEEESESSDSSSSFSSSSDEEMKKKKKERRRRRKEKKREKRRRKIIQKKEQDRDNRLKLGIKAVKLEHDCDVRCIAFNSDGSILATGGEDGLVRLWNMNEIGDFQLPFFYFSPTNEENDRKPVGSAKPINSLEFACYNSRYNIDAILIVGSNKNRRIQILDTFNLSILHELRLGRKTLWKWDEKLKCLIAYKNSESMLFSFHLCTPIIKDEESTSPIKLKSKSDLTETTQAFKFYCDCPFNFDGVKFDYAIGWKLNKPIHSFTNLQGIATNSLNKTVSNKWYILFRHQSTLEVCEINDSLVSPECRTACPLLGSLQWDIDELWEEARVKREALEWEDLKVELEGDMQLEKERWEKDFKEKQEAWEKQSMALKRKLEKEKRVFLNDEIRAAVEKELRVICEPKVLADLNSELRDSLEEELKDSIEDEIRKEYKPEIVAKLTEELRESLEEQVKISLERELRPIYEEKVKNEITLELEQKLTDEVKSTLEQKYANECRENVINELKETLEPEVKINLERQLKEEFEPIIKESLRKEIEEDIKERVEHEVKTEIRNEREAEMVQSLSNELRDSLQFEVREQMEEEMKDSVRQELESKLTEEVKSSLEQKYSDECKEKITEELKRSLEPEVKMILEQMYTDECREKVTEELKQSLEPEIKMNLEQMYADECREKVTEELKQSLESEVKMNLEQMYAEECREKIYQELKQSLESEVKMNLEKMYADECREKITEELRATLEPEIKMNLERTYADECREKISKELRETLEPEVKMNLEFMLTEECRDKVSAELRQVLEPEIRMNLEKMYADECREKVTQELRKALEPEVKMNLEFMLTEECRDKVSAELRQVLEPEIKMNLEKMYADECKEKVTQDLRKALEPEIKEQLKEEYEQQFSEQRTTEILPSEDVEVYKEEINELKLENENIEKEHEDLLMCLYDMEEKVKKYRNKLKILDALSDESESDSEYEDEEEEEEEEEEGMVEKVEEMEEIGKKQEVEAIEDHYEPEIKAEAILEKEVLKPEPEQVIEPTPEIIPSPVVENMPPPSQEQTIIPQPVQQLEQQPEQQPEQQQPIQGQGTDQLFSPDLKDKIFMTSAPSPLPSPTQISFTVPSTSQTPIFENVDNIPVVTKEINNEAVGAWEMDTLKTDTIPFDIPVSTNNDGFGAWDMDAIKTDTIPFDIPPPFNANANANVSPSAPPANFETPTQIPSFSISEAPKQEMTSTEMTGLEVSSYTMPTPEISAPLPNFAIPPPEASKPVVAAPSPEAIAPVPEIEVPEIISSDVPVVQDTEIPSLNVPTSNNNGWGFTDNWDFSDISDVPESKPVETAPVPPKPVSPFKEEKVEPFKPVSPFEEEKVEPPKSVSPFKEMVEPPKPISPFKEEKVEPSKPIESMFNDNIPFDIGTTSNDNNGWNIDGWDTGNDFVSFDDKPAATTTTTTTTTVTTTTSTSSVPAVTTPPSFFFSPPPKNDVLKSPLNKTNINNTNPISTQTSSNNFSFDGWNITSPKSSSKPDKKSDNEWGFTNWNTDTTSSNSGWGFDTSMERKSSTTSATHNNNSFADSLFKNDNTSSGNQWFTSTNTTDSLFKNDNNNSSNNWFNSTKSEDPNKKSISPLTLGSNKFGLAKSSSTGFGFGFGQRSPPSNSSFSPRSTSGFFNPPPSNSSTFSQSRRRGKNDF